MPHMNVVPSPSNRTRTAVLVAACLAVTGALTLSTAGRVRAVIQTVALYRMNEGSGASVMRDDGPFGLDGQVGDDIVTGTTHSGSTGYRWPYAAPDSSPLRPERLAVIADDPRLDPDDDDFAIEIRYRTGHGAGNIVQKGQSQTYGGYWKLEHDDGVPACLFRRNLQDQAAVAGSTSLDDGQWHTVRCARTNDEVTMHVDGDLVDRQRTSVGSIANDFDVTIGGKIECNQQSVGCDYFSGDIDYVRIDKDLGATANQSPSADFTVDCSELACTFDSAPSFDPDGTIVDVDWTFGGSNGSVTGARVDHDFARAGSYVVSVTVVDDDGATATSERTVVVQQDDSPDAIAASKFVPLSPTRLFDTRPGLSPNGYKGVVAGGTSLRVQVAGQAGIPESGVSAVAINLAVIGIEAPSFVAATPTESTGATTSSLNVVVPGDVRSNLVIVPVGDDGTVSLFSLQDAHLLGDVAGYFRPRNTPSDDGRIITQTPRRLFDTRSASILGARQRVPAGGSVTADVLDRAGIPESGVAAVVMNVTATAADGPGFVTVWPEGQRPDASSLNINGSHDTVANQVIVPVGSDGRVRFSSSIEVDLVADVLGWITDGTAATTTTGLFVPLEPSRVLDTRPDESAPGPKGAVPSDGTISARVAGHAGIPSDAGGVVLNVTLIGSGPGFATLWPSGAPRPTTSSVNVDRAGDVRPNGVIVSVGDDEQLDVYVLTTAHVVADAVGYLLP